MTTALVTLTDVIQDSQDLGSNDDHMVSRLFFNLTIGDQHYPGLHVDVKQTVGSSFETAALEVSHPVGYRGPMNHEALRTIVEDYYRSQIGGAGSAIHIGPGVSNLRMQNNRVRCLVEVKFEVSTEGSTW
jgi:hypothetical protein